MLRSAATSMETSAGSSNPTGRLLSICRCGGTLQRVNTATARPLSTAANCPARLALGRVAVLQYVYPLTAVLLDWVVYGRTLDIVQLAGVGLMGIALVAIKGRSPRKNHLP